MKSTRRPRAKGAATQDVSASGPANTGPAPRQETIRRLTWTIAAMNVHLDELRYFWAGTLGISGPQWMILMALADMDENDGVPVNAVSKKLYVDSSFITTQSKLLEKKGLIRRKAAADDARVVRMSLTDRTYKHLANLASQQQALNEFIYAEFDSTELAGLTDRLILLRDRLEKACMKVALDI